MKILKTSLPDVLVIEPRVFEDERGFFMESYHRKRYEQSLISTVFVQDNLSYSIRGTLRGLHYQYPHGQAKLVQAVKGEIFDVAVDIRVNSPTFGRWTSTRLSDRNRRQICIPEGFAHGFCVLSETAVVIYKCSNYYAPESERGILWSDPDLGIDWPVKAPLLSHKDSRYSRLRHVSLERLPQYEGKM